MATPTDGVDGPAPEATFLAYARRGRNEWWRWPITLVLSLVIVFVIAIGLYLLQRLHLIPPDLIQPAPNPRDTPLFFTSVALNFGALIVALLAAAALVQAKSLLDLVGRWRWRIFAAGAGVWLVVVVVSTLLDVAIAPHGFRYSGTPATLVLAVCALCALPIQTFAEELLFRGYLTQGLLLATKRPVVAAVVAGLLFGALHIPNGTPQAVGAAGFGIATSLIAIRLGGLAFTFGLHLINNLVGSVIVVSTGDVFNGAPGLFAQSTPGLTWWDVGVEFVCLALVVWLVLGRVAPAGSAQASPAA